MAAGRQPRARLVYLTYADPPSGIYASQVVDVCRHLEGEFGVPIRLVAFVSPRVWRDARRTLRRELPDAVVLPALPKVSMWRFSGVLFALACLALRPAGVIARSVPAATIALGARRLGLVGRVCLDGRGAIAAERREYLKRDERQARAFERLESAAVRGADFRMAVSSRLVAHWTEAYGPHGPSVVIPCTLSSAEAGAPFDEAGIERRRADLGFRPDDVVLVYAGSTSGWQSFGLMGEFCARVLAARADVKCLFLSPESAEIAGLADRFPGRVLRCHVAPREVAGMLAAGDYGMLIRERSVTNLVASPTKVAEYLAAGLPVIASDAVGDYTDFFRAHECGMIAEGVGPADLARPAFTERRRIAGLARRELSKRAFTERYRAVLDGLLGGARMTAKGKS